MSKIHVTLLKCNLCGAESTREDSPKPEGWLSLTIPDAGDERHFHHPDICPRCVWEVIPLIPLVTHQRGKEGVPNG